MFEGIINSFLSVIVFLKERELKNVKKPLWYTTNGLVMHPTYMSAHVNQLTTQHQVPTHLSFKLKSLAHLLLLIMKREIHCFFLFKISSQFKLFYISGYEIISFLSNQSTNQYFPLQFQMIQDK